MKSFKSILLVIVTLFALFGLSGCFIFRKKNRCGDCPSWGKVHSIPSNTAKEV